MSKAKAILLSYLGVLLFAAIPFLVAMKLNFKQGIIYLFIALLGTTINQLMIKDGSNITVERATEAHKGQEWDKRLLGASFFLGMATLVVCGLDAGRFEWSGEFPFWISTLGIILMMVGQTLFGISKRENNYFSSTVRIQTERNHSVCQTGPYQYIRHPGYLGMLLSIFGLPLIFSSYIAFIPSMFQAFILIIRTQYEDRFLLEHLSGYSEYVKQTRWRLIPKIF